MDTNVPSSVPKSLEDPGQTKQTSTTASLRSNSYNPFEHREVEHPNGDIRSLANLVKASLGSGILAMPLAFSNAGWLVGLFGTVIIGFICGHCVHTFVRVSRECCKIERIPLLTYSETCRSTFVNGPKGCKRFATAAYVFAEVSLLLTYLGTCCIYTVLIANSLKQLFDKYVFSFHCRLEIYCFAILIPLCFLSQIKHLKWLAPLSFTANALLTTTFAICLYYIFGEKISITDKRMAADITRFPAYLSTVIFALEGIGVVMPVENHMKHPEHFIGCPSILVVAITLIALMYTVLGLFGYLRYGDVLRGSITLNLPIDHWPAIGANICIAVSILLSYPLHFYVVIDIVLRFLLPRIREKHRFITEIIVRVVIVCISVILQERHLLGGIGIALPLLEQIINIVGALFYSTLGIIIPGIVETVLEWHNLGRLRWIFWKNVVIVLFGIFAMVSGCTISILDIVNLNSS